MSAIPPSLPLWGTIGTAKKRAFVSRDWARSPLHSSCQLTITCWCQGHTFLSWKKFATTGRWQFNVWLCMGSLHHEILLKREGWWASVIFVSSIDENGRVQVAAVSKVSAVIYASISSFFYLCPPATTFLSVPNERTSAILLVPENSMQSLSIPQPQPPVGGRPHSSASRYFSSIPASGSPS